MPVPMNIEVDYQYKFDNTYGSYQPFLTFWPEDKTYDDIISLNPIRALMTGIHDPDTDQFIDLTDAINYYVSNQGGGIIDQINTFIGSNVYSLGGYTFNDKHVNDALALKVDKVSGKGLSANDYTTTDKNKLVNLATVASTGSYTDLTNKPTIPTIPTRNQSSVTLSLNTGAQISSTRDAQVSYTVGVANVLTLTGGAAGYVALEIATNSGFTTGLQEVGRFGNSNTGGLVVGLTLNDSIQGNISGFVPAGYYRRLKTYNTTGTPTYSYLSGQETLL